MATSDIDIMRHLRALRAQAAADPDATEALANGLFVAADRLHTVGATARALSVAQELVALRRRVTGSDPSSDLHLMHALRLLGECLVAVSADDEAIEIFEECLTLCNLSLSTGASQQTRALRAAILERIADIKSRRYSMDEAVEDLAAAIDDYRILAEAGQAGAETGVARALYNSGVMAVACDRANHGIADLDQAIEIYSGLLEQGDTSIAGELSRALQGRAALTERLGLDAASSSSVNAGQSAYRQAAETDPAVISSGLEFLPFDVSIEFIDGGIGLSEPDSDQPPQHAPEGDAPRMARQISDEVVDLTDALRVVQDQIEDALTASARSALRFTAGPIEVEFLVKLVRSSAAGGGIRLVVVLDSPPSVLGKTSTSADYHRIKLTLTPEASDAVAVDARI